MGWDGRYRHEAEEAVEAEAEAVEAEAEAVEAEVEEVKGAEALMEVENCHSLALKRSHCAPSVSETVSQMYLDCPRTHLRVHYLHGHRCYLPQDMVADGLLLALPLQNPPESPEVPR